LGGTADPGFDPETSVPSLEALLLEPKLVLPALVLALAPHPPAALDHLFLMVCCVVLLGAARRHCRLPTALFGAARLGAATRQLMLMCLLALSACQLCWAVLGTFVCLRYLRRRLVARWRPLLPLVLAAVA